MGTTGGWRWEWEVRRGDGGRCAGAARTSRGQPPASSEDGTEAGHLEPPQNSYLHGEVDVVLDAGEVLLDGSVGLLQLPLDTLRHDLLSHRAAAAARLIASRGLCGEIVGGQMEQKKKSFCGQIVGGQTEQKKKLTGGANVLPLSLLYEQRNGLGCLS
jgi:hypothetical protein|uniref:Uncharacterized protein n=1 Tax=Zea mays TaxID=4577 RepID=A0A804NL97_MAIZE